MRKAFADTLIQLAEQDERIWLLTGDLGFNTFEGFREKFPNRFINCGIAEQNMVGVAAGLAMEGQKPYVYSIIPFITFRCLEQIRNDVCYQNLDVKIVGAGKGERYKHLGFTHVVSDEDIEIISTLPNIEILDPETPEQTEQMVLESYKNTKPSYLRI